MANRWGTMETVRTLFWGAPKSLQMVTAAIKLKDACLLLERKAVTSLDSILKSRDITLPTKVHLVKAMFFPVVIYGCESWTVKKAEHQKLMLLNCGVGEDSWESLGLQGDPTSPSWRKSILSIHWKDWCWSWNSHTLATWCEELTHWKNPYAGKDWRWEEKGTSEDEMVGWHHWLKGRESEHTQGDSDGQKSLACYSGGCKESDMT